MNLEQNRYKIRLKSHHDSKECFQYLTKGPKLLLNQLRSEYKKSHKDTVYIHIPFCKKMCTFCNMRRNIKAPSEDYADLIVQQIKNYSRFHYIQNSRYDAVYFGGGTPTALSKEDLKKIIIAIKEYLPLTEDCEITIETTVSELTDEKIQMFYEEGVNRFSVGIQTFSDQGRKTLGRIGDHEAAIDKLKQLKKTGFSNVNIDIIYNYPGETLEEAVKDIKYVIDLDLAGFSFYSLIINDKALIKKTTGDSNVFYHKNFEREKLFFSSMVEEAYRGGYNFLELTKLVKPNGDKYKYIVRRYEGGDTLPLGAGAGGYIGNTLIMNSFNMNQFKEEVENIDKIKGIEVQDEYNVIQSLIGQVQMTKIDLDKIREIRYRLYVEKFMKVLVEEGFVMKRDDKYYLTPKGIFWGNNISKNISDIVLNAYLDSKKDLKYNIQ